MMKVLDLETTIVRENVTEKIEDVMMKDNVTFASAVMYADVGETCERIITHYGRNNTNQAILNLPPDIYYTWNGSRFDHHFLYHLFRRNGYTVKEKFNGDNSRKRQLLVKEMTYLLAGSKILTLTVHTHRGIIEFRDACLLFSTNLATFIRNTCPEHPKLEGTYDYTKERYVEADFSDTDKLYCEADIRGFAIGLHRIKEQFMDYFDMDILSSLTAGSFAMKFAKNKMIDNLNFENEEDLEDLFDTRNPFPREFISGGRTYVNPENKAKIFNGISKIDSNSAYPASMVNRKHPLGDFVKFKCDEELLKTLLEEHPNAYVFARLVDGFVYYNDKFSPITVKKDGACLYPNFATSEDNVYLDDYTLRDEKLSMKGQFEVYVFKQTTLDIPVFEYMREIYELKNKFKKEGKKGLELAVKIILNSTFGKFLQRDEIPEYDFFEGVIKRVKDGALNVNKEFFAWYIYPPMGASITASVRHELCTYMNSMGENFIYCDTDSLIYTGETPSAIPLGNELGQWKEESTKTGITSYNEKCEVAGDFIAFQPKTYALMLDGKLKLTFCGISDNAVKEKFKEESTVNDVLEAMKEGISFDVLRTFRTLSGVALLEKSIQKKIKVVEDYRDDVALYNRFMMMKEMKHSKDNLE